MDKLERRFQFVSMHTIGPYESWLSDLAEKGLFLKKIGNMFCQFEKREPMKMEYRVEILIDRISRERISMYEECGWKYVTSYKWGHIFCTPDSESYVEIHTDTVEQGYTLKEVTKRMRILSTITILDAIVMLALMIFMFNIGQTPSLNMIQNGVMVITSEISMICVLVIMIKQTREYSNIKRQLFSGKVINHHASYKKNHIYNKVMLFINFLLIAVIMANNVIIGGRLIGTISGTNVYDLTEEKNKLPIVRLADIEDNVKLVLKNNNLNYSYNHDNFVKTDISMLTFDQYEVYESGIIEGEMWDDLSGVYSPSLRTEYYELAFPSMSEGVLQDLMVKYIETYFGLSEVEISKISYKELDNVYIAVEREAKSIFASDNNKVIYVRYYGKKDVMKIVEKLPDILK